MGLNRCSVGPANHTAREYSSTKASPTPTMQRRTSEPMTQLYPVHLCTKLEEGTAPARKTRTTQSRGSNHTDAANYGVHQAWGQSRLGRPDDAQGIPHGERLETTAVLWHPTAAAAAAAINGERQKHNEETPDQLATPSSPLLLSRIATHTGTHATRRQRQCLTLLWSWCILEVSCQAVSGCVVVAVVVSCVVCLLCCCLGLRGLAYQMQARGPSGTI